MVVTMLGAGGMARGIATRLIAGGAELQILGPNAAKATQLAYDLGAASVGVTSGVIGNSLAGDIVIVAVPYSAVAKVLGEYDGQLDGRILVDITNPLTTDFDALVTPADSSAAEEIAKLLPLGVVVVKAFNTTFASTLLAGEVAGQPLDIFIAGDDDGAKSRVARLVEASGLIAIDAGPLHRARQLEAIGLLHITLQTTRDTGFHTAVKIIE